MSKNSIDDEITLRRRLRDDYPFYAINALFIKQKKVKGLIPFEFNIVQKFIHYKVEEQKRKTGKIRAIIVKGRQEGCSTYCDGRLYHNVTHNPGTFAFILAHIKKSSEILFKMVKRFHDNCPEYLKPITSKNNASSLEFSELDGGFTVGTSKTPDGGRGDTIHYLHCSEAAYYNNAEDLVSGLLESVPDEPGTEIFIESTANGIGNWFHLKWLDALAGKDDYIAIFVPWYWQLEYTLPAPSDFSPTEEELELISLYKLTNDQLNWRRLKIIKFAQAGIDGTKKFKQEYPNNSIEAFQLSGGDTYITSEEVMPARLRARNNEIEPYGPLIIGVDPARSKKGDRTAIIRRKGRVAYGLETYKGKDGMEVVGIINTIIQEEKPDKVFIDEDGIGGPILDRLRELGYGPDLVVGVQAGSTKTLLYPRRYFNKRAEMWGLCLDWLKEGNVAIPDSDELHSDLCAPLYKWSSNSTLIIESKDDMKGPKRNLPSPDTADALNLTFAQPVVMNHIMEKRRNNRKEAIRKLMAPAQKVKNIKKAYMK